MTFGHEGGYWMNEDQRGGHSPPPQQPTPWLVDGSTVYKLTKTGGVNVTSATFQRGRCSEEETHECAAFAARALNCHEELLAACRDAFDALGSDSTGVILTARKAVADAIAKAEGRAK